MRSTRFPHRSQIDRKYNLSTHIHTDISHYCIAFSFSLSFLITTSTRQWKTKKNSVVLISTNDEDKRTSKKYGDKSAKKWRKGERGREGGREGRTNRKKQMLLFFYSTYVCANVHDTSFSFSFSIFLLDKRSRLSSFFSLYCSTICCICRSKKRKRTTDQQLQGKVVSHLSKLLALYLPSSYGLIKDSSIE